MPLALKDARLHLVGCGNMGSALLRGWLAAGVPASQVSARVASTASAELLSMNYGIRASTTTRYDGEDIVVLGVKPQMLDAVLDEHWHPAPGQPLYVSIAAGKRLSYFAQKLGARARVIRAMPNTPALVGKGVTTLVASRAAEADMPLALQLFEACGLAIPLADEAQLDAAAAVAGSGPAYVFHFIEAFTAAAQAVGLDADTALALVRGTLTGSLALADAEGWEDAARLRGNVTSKGGVTHAALEVLMPRLEPLLKEALEANIHRSGELA